MSKAETDCITHVREEEAKMTAEEQKLERLRHKIEDQDWKIIRGQVSVHERDVGQGFVDLDGASGDSSPVTEPFGNTLNLITPSITIWYTSLVYTQKPVRLGTRHRLTWNKA
jgi:hypothetical protein